MKNQLQLSITILCLSFPALLKAQCDTCSFNYKVVKQHDVLNPNRIYIDKADTNEYDACPDGSEDHKSITFVHGLGGTVESWDLQKNWVNDHYNASAISANYGGAGWESSFATVAQKLNSDIGSVTAHGINQVFPYRCKKNDFVIAHSQGGIATRYLDLMWDTDIVGTFGDRKFFGLATFGTPHAGADIALTKDQHAAFIANVVDAVFLEKLYNYRGWIKGVDKMIDSLNSFTEKRLTPIMLAGLHTKTLDEMRPGSSTMNKINRHTSRLHKVAFYGTENAPECWRVMDNIVTKSVEDYPLFGAIKDETFMKKVQAVQHDHEAKIASNKRKLKKSSWLKPLDHLKNSKRKKEIKAREKALQFLYNANTEWRFLIGSYHRDSFETEITKKFIVTWQEKYGWLGKWYAQSRTFFDLQVANDFSNSIDHSVYKVKDKKITTQKFTVKRLKFFPSDGVILERSQRAFPGVGTRTERMRENNHFQERNSPETQSCLESLLSGHYDSYFKTRKTH